MIGDSNNNLTIRFAQVADLNSVYELDQHLEQNVLAQKIMARQIMVSLLSGEIIGLLRYNLFWDEIPFMNLLRIRDAYQRRGYGKALVAKWENEMLQLHHTMVLTSTLANEQAQHFYRQIGYTDIGSFVLPSEPLEIMLFKKIG